jgi:hypothetical protein
VAISSAAVWAKPVAAADAAGDDAPAGAAEDAAGAPEAGAADDAPAADGAAAAELLPAGGALELVLADDLLLLLHAVTSKPRAASATVLRTVIPRSRLFCCMLFLLDSGKNTTLLLPGC